jgi:hypothetical protein
MNTTDPLGLSAFSTHIFDSIAAMAPAAAVGLFVILFLIGVLRIGR